MVCPTCGAKLQPSIGQGRLSALIGLCFTVAICYFLGLSSEWFLIATILLWFPVFVICGFIIARVVPPRFETFDSFTSLGLLDTPSTRGDSHGSGDRPATDSQKNRVP